VPFQSVPIVLDTGNNSYGPKTSKKVKILIFEQIEIYLFRQAQDQAGDVRQVKGNRLTYYINAHRLKNKNPPCLLFDIYKLVRI
jgi:hypothetical protein